MIELVFTGILKEDSMLVEREGKQELCFDVDVQRYKKQADGRILNYHITIHCVKHGTCTADKRFVKGQKIYIRGDISPRVISERGEMKAEIWSNVWQFELM